MAIALLTCGCVPHSCYAVSLCNEPACGMCCAAHGTSGCSTAPQTALGFNCSPNELPRLHCSHCCLQVRANSLQELVYKQGQAGVTKATVSITFNNLDKANSPVGYEQHDRLVVTRQVSLLWYQTVIQSEGCLH